MLGTRAYSRSAQPARPEIDLDVLGQALHHSFDLTFLQSSELVQLPCVARRCRRNRHGLEPARALRKELIAAAEHMTQRTWHHYPIAEIAQALEEDRLSSHNGSNGQHAAEIQRSLGVPFPRARIDIARYYSIRLVMEGLSNETIADFLQVELRTLSNYIAEAKNRIRVILENE